MQDIAIAIQRNPVRKSAASRFGSGLTLWLLGLTILATLGGCASKGELVDGDEIPPEIARIPDAVPKVEPLAKSGNPESYVVHGKRFFPLRNSLGHVERGLASWYGEPFHGRKTSSGEIYDMHAMTAAHKTLPLPTYARVTNTENGRSVVVRINDRGPFHGSRIIDLSYTAAVKLGVTKKGTAMVEVRAIDPRHPKSDRDSDRGPFLAEQAATPKPTKVSTTRRPPTSQTKTTASRGTRQPLYLQIGAFGDPKNAEKLRTRLTSQLVTEKIRILSPQSDGPPLYRVRIGPIPSAHDANRLAQQITSLGLESPHWIGN
ncbi:rare lipoprotein A [Thiorhodococcus drewsii AZ1]|uniref:Endolytic peptidoglycan transglycosylase RlpA n=1 Tax=Thiorhodococcus drewsii AZ1 TaxID=765913 RepID=G2DVL7_9GAMM|nr:septal ring lytic transglycosylase RlpA family protein [Thiorhodococcus drewsii]EGV34032.1 rare lipoprotein A [Thiorhodococcus drewsii AZ1]